MKFPGSLFLFFVLHLACKNKPQLPLEDSTILINYCISDLQSKRAYISRYTYHLNDSKRVLPLLDSITRQLEVFRSLTNSRDSIIDYLDKNGIKLNEDTYPVDSFLIINYESFKSNTLSAIKELHYINKFTDQLYWDFWQCIMDFDTLRLVANDTILLYENSHYDIPIICPSKILSNSLQSKSETMVSFDTGKSNNKIQKVYYTCNAMNEVTREHLKYQDSIVMRVIPKDY